MWTHFICFRKCASSLQQKKDWQAAKSVAHLNKIQDLQLQHKFENAKAFCVPDAVLIQWYLFTSASQSDMNGQF